MYLDDSNVIHLRDLRLYPLYHCHCSQIVVSLAFSLLPWDGKVVCLGLNTDIYRLWRDTYFRCKNPNCFLYEGNNAINYNEVAYMPFKFPCFCNLRLSILNDVRYNFWLLYLFVAFSVCGNSILICASCFQSCLC